MNSVRSMHQAGEAGRVVLARGRCLQQFGSGEPYLPMFEALEQLGQALGRRLVEVLRSRAPTWLMHLPSLVSLEDRVKLRDEVFGSTRERMLREITDALETLSSETPLVIALEDLHWSDRATLHLIDFIARRRGSARLMWLASFRLTDVVAREHPLNHLRHELRLHELCEEIVLDPFSGSATTLAVAKKMKRRFIGFDLSTEYVEQGTKRLAQTHAGDPLDGAPEPTMSAPSTANGRRLGDKAAANGHRRRSRKAAKPRERVLFSE